MAQIKLTKNELRSQELHLAQLSRYLPTLKLKKALLQLEVQGARLELEEQQRAFSEISHKVGDYTGLFKEHISVDVEVAGKVLSVNKAYENIAGVWRFPILKGSPLKSCNMPFLIPRLG
jgi:V/A-type H+/Na+-transporting ATPase subunit D